MKGKILLSLIIGVILGGVTLVVLLFVLPELAMPLGLLVLALGAIAMHVVLSITEARMNKQYAKIEQLLQSPILYQTVANFNLGNGVVSGKIYVCQSGIVLASVDQTPHAVQQISADQLARYEQEDIHLRLYTKDGSVYHLVLPDAPEVVEAIKTHYWNG